MIKRIIIIGAFTGTAHISMLFVIKKLSETSPISVIKSIGEVDSLFNLITSILASGLLMTSVREITISQNWKEPLLASIRARFTLSLLLITAAIAGFFNPVYWLMLFAPVFALNPDYALYAKGKSVMASFLAFIRVVVPSIVLMISSYFFDQQIIILFSASIILMYLTTGVYTSYILQSNYLVSPSLRSLTQYLETLPMGVVSFSYYFLGLGLIIPTTYFYVDERTVAISYIIIKIYVVFKSALRIINQTFISDMVEDEVCAKVDQIAMLGGLAFLASALFFPEGFLNLFADEKIVVADLWIYLLGITGFIVSPFISLTTKAILERKDRPYAKIAFISIVLSASIIALFSIFNVEEGVLIGLIAGELYCVIGLLMILKQIVLLKQRLEFLVKNSYLLTIPASIRWFAGDNTRAFLVFIVMFLITALLANKKKVGFKPIN
ncbi:MAG TPA: hypothetical protein VF144_13815 [Chitinophagaceae bacterium]